MPPRNAFIIAMTGLVSLLCYTTAMEHRPAAPLAKALLIIKERFVRDIPQEKLVEAAFKGMLSELDEYSEYIPPASAEIFQQEIAQSFPGIGILIDKRMKQEYVRVVTPLVGSPALRAGMLPGDELREVDGQSLKGLGLDEVRKQLRGPEGTAVKIRVKRLGKEEFADVEVTRGEIPVDSVVGYTRNDRDEWVFRIPEHPEIAYVRITMFGDRTVDEFTKAVTSLKGTYSAMVLDLRSNPGGLLDSAAELCDLFLDQGVIVEMRERDATLDPLIAEPGVLIPHDKPLVIMINRDSASASEVTSACLKENGRASVAGERSYGKGTIQEVIALDSGHSLIKLTTARYFGPNGQVIHRDKGATEDDVWGVKPNPGLELKVDEKQIRAMEVEWSRASFPRIAQDKLKELGLEPESPTDNDVPVNSEDKNLEVTVIPEPTPDSTADTATDPPSTDLLMREAFEDRQLKLAVDFLTNKSNK